MSEFEYSLDALNAKTDFLRVTTIIYVEGDDDVLFWNEIFSKIPDFTFEIEPCGGVEELDKYIPMIESGNLKAIAARDADYLTITQQHCKSPLVLYTCGHSIENTLYSENSLILLTKMWCRIPGDSTATCASWLQKFSRSFQDILIRDIANYISHAGINVIHENCTPFMTGKYSPEPCSKKIAFKVAELDNLIPAMGLKSALEIFKNANIDVALKIRGHFFASAVAKFITKIAENNSRKISLSSDGLYVSAMTYFAQTLTTSHPHGQYYLSSARNAALAIDLVT